MYSWIPFFTELATKILDWENRQPELIAMLREAGVKGGLDDQDKEGQTIPLEEIDPLTFFAQINKYGTTRRKAIIAGLHDQLNLESNLPDDFAGVPTAFAQAVWFFGYVANREPSVIPLLWQLGREIVVGTISPDLFNQSLALKFVGPAKLTQAMFWLNPEKYLPIDSQTKRYLDKAGVNTDFGDFSGYQRILSEARDKYPGQRFCQISHQAWLENNPVVPEPDEDAKACRQPGKRYWLWAPGKGARYWDEFYSAGIMAIGWDYLGDLTSYSSKEEIAEAIREHDQDLSSKKNDATACHSFAHDVQPGDGVFAKQGGSRILGYGEVQSGYTFDDGRESYKSVIQVEWLKKGVWEVGDESHFALKTLTDVTGYPDFLAALKSLVGLESEYPRVAEGRGSAIAYWWINANPKRWDFANTPVGGTQIYTSHTAEGARRQRSRHFATVAAGDLIVGYVTSPLKEIVAICEVTKPLGPTNEGEGFEFKKLRQYQQTICWNELMAIPALSNSEPLRNHQGSLFRLTADEFEIIRTLLDERNETTQLAPRPPYTLADALNELFMPQEQFTEAVELLRHKKNIILQGPPGVGKTFMAKRLAYVLMGEKADERIKSVQFHQSFSYEDFIQGIRPSPGGGFMLKNGLFHRFCRNASHDSSHDYVFIIDEINRGNLSKIFGEAMMLIESDKRGQEVLLAYSEEDETFTIPHNVHIIGTMNTADRSLALVDYALRRRFCFVDVPPAFRSKEGARRFGEYLLGNGASAALVQEIVDKLQAVNQKIAEDTKSLGPEYQLGHSYFIEPKPATYDKAWLRRIVHYELAPLLREYWFDSRDKADGRIESLLA